MTQMNQNLLLTLFSPLISTIIVLFFISAKKAISANPQFLACNPATCGDGQNITFPFHIQDLQKPFCGFPGFNLSCNNNRPILKLQDNEFVIRTIDYRNQIFRVSNAAVFDTAATCIPPFKNTSLPDDRFTLFSNQTTLFLLFDCNSTLNRNSELNKYAVGCLINETGPTLSMFSDNPHLGYASEVCEENVLLPVDVDGAVDRWTTDGEELERVIERGFVLNWMASNCSICEASGGKCGFDYASYHFKCFCPDRPHAWRCNPENNKLRLKLGLGLGLAGGIGLLGLLLAIYITRSHYKKRNDSSDFLSTNSFSRSNLEGGGVYLRVSVFSYAELEKATSSFDNKKELGDGGFGTVYYGKLKDGREVAVKRLYQHNYKRVEQFMNEIDILTRLRHKNLVTLYGCTSRRCRELLLVYEYVPNGTVADHLHGDLAKSSTLTWPIRMSIAMETASALAYLHASDIIHRDVKTNNILLDKNFCVKVADFGLSRLFPNDVTHVSTAPQGTPGYVDPEYHLCYQLTSKSDVYSFGVVLIELISSMPAVDISRHRHEINLANFAVNKIQQCAFNELIDPSLGYGSDEEVKRTTILVAELAFRCLQQDKEMRPSMDEVLEELKRIESKEYREREEWLHDEREPPPAKTVPPPSPPNSDEASLLKSVRMPPPPSPDTVTAQWSSSCSTTPNISS